MLQPSFLTVLVGTNLYLPHSEKPYPRKEALGEVSPLLR